MPVPPAALAGALGNPATKTVASNELKVAISTPNLNLLEIKWNVSLVAIF